MSTLRPLPWARPRMEREAMKMRNFIVEIEEV